MALNTYKALERNELPNPPLRYLVNCSKALGVPLGAVLEPEWLEWFQGQPVPPPKGWWPTPTETRLGHDGVWTTTEAADRPPPDWLLPYLRKSD